MTSVACLRNSNLRWNPNATAHVSLRLSMYFVLFANKNVESSVDCYRRWPFSSNEELETDEVMAIPDGVQGGNTLADCCFVPYWTYESTSSGSG